MNNEGNQKKAKSSPFPITEEKTPITTHQDTEPPFIEQSLHGTPELRFLDFICNNDDLLSFEPALPTIPLHPRNDI